MLRIVVPSLHHSPALLAEVIPVPRTLPMKATLPELFTDSPVIVSISTPVSPGEAAPSRTISTSGPLGGPAKIAVLSVPSNPPCSSR